MQSPGKAIRAHDTVQTLMSENLFVETWSSQKRLQKSFCGSADSIENECIHRPPVPLLHPPSPPLSPRQVTLKYDKIRAQFTVTAKISIEHLRILHSVVKPNLADWPRAKQPICRTCSFWTFPNYIPPCLKANKGCGLMLRLKPRLRKSKLTSAVLKGFGFDRLKSPVSEPRCTRIDRHSLLNCGLLKPKAQKGLDWTPSGTPLS